MASFVYDDGGRAAAGFKGKTGDCSCRSIAIATGKPYGEVYDALTAIAAGKRPSKRHPKGHGTARTGVSMKVLKAYLSSIGWRWVPTMAIGSGCTVHLSAGELPAGRIIVRLSKHMTTMIDGVIHDTFDPRLDVHCVEPDRGQPIKAGQGRNSNGICSIQRRCVYGYFIAPDAA